MRAGFGEDLVAGADKLLEQGRDRKLGKVAVYDVPAMPFPKMLVDIRDRASEMFLSRRVRGSYDVPASGSVTEKLGLLRHHVLLRAVVELVAYGERRRVPLRKD